MGYTIHVDQEAGCLFIRYCDGKLAEDLVAVIEEVAARPELRDLDRRLHDFRGHREQLSGAAIRAVARRSEELEGALGPRRRVAVVAPEPVTFGQGRMYQSYSDERSRSLRVFRTFDEAASWLKLPLRTRDPFAKADEPETDPAS